MDRLSITRRFEKYSSTQHHSRRFKNWKYSFDKLQLDFIEWFREFQTDIFRLCKSKKEKENENESFSLNFFRKIPLNIIIISTHRNEMFVI